MAYIKFHQPNTNSILQLINEYLYVANNSMGMLLNSLYTKKTNILIMLFYIANYPVIAQTLEQYMKNNGLEINSKEFELNIDTKIPDAFLSDLDSKKLLLLGEDHRLISNPIIQFNLINIISRGNYKNIILEEGCGLGYFMNRFINSSDTISLSIILNDYNSYYGEYEDIDTLLQRFINNKITFLKKIQELNQTLPENMRYKIYGIDYEGNNFQTAYLALQFILKNSLDTNNYRISNCLKVIRGVLQLIETEKYKNMEKPSHLKLYKIMGKKNDFDYLLGSDYLIFLKLLENIHKSYLVVRNKTHNRIPIGREKFMYKNMISKLILDSNNKCIAVLGAEHVKKKVFMPLIFGRISTKCENKIKSPYKNKTASILPVIISARSISPLNLGIYFSDFYYIEDSICENDLKFKINSDYCKMVHISGSDSIFKKTSKSAQYLMFVNDSTK